MSKGLEALKKIDYTICLNINNGTLKFGLDKYDGCDCKNFSEFDVCYELIEKSLKDYEELKDRLCITDVVKEDIVQLWKEHNTLEIIKKKQVAVDEFIRCCKEESNSLGEYNNFAGDKNSLTKKEYKLLKEELL